MTTYTVMDEENGVMLGRGLNAVEAMAAILTYDSYRFEIRRNEHEGVWELWRSDGSANSVRGASRMRSAGVYSAATDETDATQEIAETVIRARWSRLPVARSDDQYDEMMAQAAEGDA